MRRDFTVNALFYDPISKTTHDWTGGEKDLKARIVRTIGKPEERFGEDHLRLLRAIRFATQLNFEIEPETFAAVKRLAPKIKLISAERIRDELIKLFRPPYAARGLDLLRDSGLMEHVLPELVATITCDQSPDYHPEGSVYNHIRLMLAQLPPDAPESLPWAVLLHDIGKPPTASVDERNGAIHFYGHEKIGADMSQEILNRLRFPKKEIDETVATVRQHMQFKDVKQMRKSDSAPTAPARHLPAGTGTRTSSIACLAPLTGTLRFPGGTGQKNWTSNRISARRCSMAGT